MKQATEEEFKHWEFDDDFVTFLRERNEKRQRPRTIGQYYPSSLARCVLLQILEWDNAEISDDTLRHFFAGEVYQDHIIDPVMEWKWGRNCVRLEQRVAIPIRYDEKSRNGELIWIRGRIDELTFLYIDDVVCAIPNECKSQKGGINYRNEPNPDHVGQLMVYLAAIGAPYGKLIYIDRSVLKCRTFHIEYDEAVFNAICDRARYIHFWVLQKDKELPPPEASLSKGTKWKCRKDYCPKLGTCRKIRGMIKEIEKNVESTD